MTRTRSMLRNSFVPMTLIVGSVAVTGCVDSPQEPVAAETAASTVDHTVISDAAALNGLPLQSTRYQSSAQGDSVTVSDPAWTQTAPGEWTRSAQGTTTTLKVEPVKNLVVRPNVTCNLNFYLGISSPLVGFSGEAAIGQADCLDGAVAFTITVEVCTDLAGCVVQSASGVGSPGAPFTFGIAVPGTAGASCFGEVVWNPPGVFVSQFNLCG